MQSKKQKILILGESHHYERMISLAVGLFFLAAVLLLGFPNVGQAKTWLVGPDFALKKPSAAIKRAKNGDTIKIIAGIYENDYASINQDNLTLVGMNGFAHLKSTGHVPGGKAIWVTNGKNLTIRNVEFSGTKVPDKNGAGIRLQRGSLTLDNCYFHDNEIGILTSGRPDIKLVIKNTEFSHNTQNYPVTGRLSHNIYVGAIAEFIMENSISRGARYGHTVKSRARKTIIKNSRIFDEGEISASYLIDIPNGGKALIKNNYLYKNKGAQNNALISYGAEGMKYEDNSLTIKYNMAINESGMAFLLRNHSDVEASFVKNNVTNILSDKISGVKKGGLWDNIKNKISDYLN